MHRLVLDEEEADFTFSAAMIAVGLKDKSDDEEKARKLKIMARAREILAKEK